MKQTTILFFLLTLANLLPAQFSSLELNVGNFKGTGVWGDIDRDGDLDIIVSGIENGSQPITRFYLQTGNHEFVCSNISLPYADFHNPMDIGDYNNDGLPDLLIGNTIFRNLGNLIFNQIAISNRGKFIDYDNDGDLDVVGIQVHRNDGNDVFVNTGISLSGYWADFNNDGLIDLFSQGEVLINDGYGSFTPVAWLGWGDSAPCFGNYNNGGGIDIYFNGEIYINIQNGLEFLPAYAVDENGESITGEGITWGDFDNDGDLDLLTKSRLYLNNDGLFETNLSMPLGSMYPHGISTADYDNDGDLDILVIGFDPGTFYPVVNRVYNNTTGNVNTPPQEPNGLSTSYSGDYVVFAWQPSWDEQTPVNGLKYSLCIPGVNSWQPTYHNWEPGVINSNCYWKIRASALVNQSTYYWYARAIDVSRSASDWSQSTYSPLEITTPSTAIVGGSTYQAHWIANPFINDINIFLSLSSESNWIQLNQNPVPSQAASFSFTVPDTLSLQCRVKIESATNNNVYSISGLFGITPSAPWIQLLSSSNMDIGLAYIGWQSEIHEVVLKNAGSSPMTINNVSFMNNNSPFILNGINTPIVVGAGSTATIGVVFVPHVSGTATDSLYVSSDSVNNPLLRIRLQAYGEYVPPMAPDNITISIDNDSILVSWDAVTQSIYGTPLEPDYYIVFYNGGSDVNGTYYYLDYSDGLSYIHDGVLQHSDHFFYKVRAFKEFRETGVQLLRSCLTHHMTELEVVKTLSGTE